MIHSFLLIGQSNMAGRGSLKDARSVDMSRIHTLRNGRWQPMFRPINPDRSFSGVSLAESFAESYVKAYGVDVGLICCADGGTTLEQWMPDGLLYDNAVFQARLAQRTSTIVGVLWHQGESDCTDDRHPVYREKLETMLARLRKDLRLEDVPVLLGGLGDFLADCPRDAWQLKNYTVINDAQRAVAASSERMGFVSAEGLTSNPDRLHFDAASLHEFGRRYFAEYERLLADGGPVCGAAVGDDLVRSDMERL